MTKYLCLALALVALHPTAAVADDEEDTGETTDQPAQDPEPPPPEAPALPDDYITLNGGFWLNYTYNRFDPTDRDKVGDFGPGNSMFRVGFDARKRGILASFRMRWYSYARVWEYGWVGYKFDGGSQLEVGMTKVPFGVLPYAGYDYWFDLPYYVGLNNQYDLGAKWTGHILSPAIELSVGAFKNSDIAASDDLARFSYDIVTVNGNPLARNEATNEVAARLAATLGPAEVGASAYYGGLYNLDTRDTGHHWAAAVHVNATYDRCSAQLQAMQYAYVPQNAPLVGSDVVVIGAFADAYPIAARAKLVEANVGCDIYLGDRIDAIKLYNNHSILLKDPATFDDSQMNVVGLSVLAGPIFGFVDLISAKNAPYIGTPTATALSTGEPNAGWHSMFNVNIGFYFKTDALSWWSH